VETTNLMHVGWGRPILHSLDFGGVDRNALHRHYKTKENNRGLGKSTLFQV
jgi:hypothetical protein